MSAAAKSQHCAKCGAEIPAIGISYWSTSGGPFCSTHCRGDVPVESQVARDRRMFRLGAEWQRERLTEPTAEMISAAMQTGGEPSSGPSARMIAEIWRIMAEHIQPITDADIAAAVEGK